MWGNIYKYGATFINVGRHLYKCGAIFLNVAPYLEIWGDIYKWGGIDCEARFINFYVDIKDIKIIFAYSRFIKC